MLLNWDFRKLFFLDKPRIFKNADETLVTIQDKRAFLNSHLRLFLFALMSELLTF